MKKFEYKVASISRKGMNSVIDMEEMETLLTGEGLIGWEVINTFDNLVNKKIALCFLMKREIE